MSAIPTNGAGKPCAPSLPLLPPPLSAPPPDEAVLSPLEKALLSHIERGQQHVETALNSIAVELKQTREQTRLQTQMQSFGLLLLWITLMFLIGLVGLSRGVDPRIAADAIQTVTPALPPSKPSAQEP